LQTFLAQKETTTTHPCSKTRPPRQPNYTYLCHHVQSYNPVMKKNEIKLRKSPDLRVNLSVMANPAKS